LPGQLATSGRYVVTARLARGGYDIGLHQNIAKTPD
jgi:hypothetical protein